MKRTQALAIQICTVLRKHFPLQGDSDANIETAFLALNKAYPNFNGALTDEAIKGYIETVRHQLSKDPEVADNIREMQTQRTDIWWTIASLKIVLDYAGPDLSLAHLLYAVDECSAQLPKSKSYHQKQAEYRQTVKDDDEKAALRQQLIDWFMPTQKQYAGLHPQVWQVELRKEQNRIGSKNLDELRQEVATRTEKRRIAGLDKDVRRQEVAGLRTAQPASSKTYEPLPLTMPNPRPGMGNQTLDLSAEGLKRLSSQDYGLFKYIVRTTSHEAINNRLNGID